MTRKQRIHRIHLAHSFLEHLKNELHREICFFFMNGCDHGDICRRLKISRQRLEAEKLAIAFKMRKFGIVPD